MPPVKWDYRRIGGCQGCPVDNVRLWIPIIPTLHTATPPEFCFKCRVRLEERLTKDPPDIAVAMIRVRD